MAQQTPSCKPQACAIQNCLFSNNYNESRCDQAINDLYRCCEKFYKETNSKGVTPCCPKPDLLRTKMTQRGLQEE
ncbi:hypothetical protein ZYGR_0I02460 [Zygosaccharomyces rouxii]|uniref:Cx9C motif-containing protein 4, mitochondrial n=2 Tax=Zygosaccharomyces rouxii TaxID=4956 RepID=CMC4_ZYGRC|nr:uncharacterized protein ZYRO0C05830g [Zygosaccharomyces rouxii]C5DT65.1 RecName: Full=Cx9C motif-containing protein 4, mitochondrial [Zygosaccharomyces rouxii CBS 732]GAV47950.1 hypothetical protein ZYGR_0I02460 [Zygosaccharomyces rouxii]CAR26976.1 ZYRO0C05830p [Zygosaccharomyces rouxii]